MSNPELDNYVESPEAKRIHKLEVEVAQQKEELSEANDYRHAWRLVAGDEAKRIQFLEAVLREIEKGEGPYSRDHLTHAENTIEAMKKLAQSALTSQGSWLGYWCLECRGSGCDACNIVAPQGTEVKCPECGGKGEVLVPIRSIWAICPFCSGGD